MILIYLLLNNKFLNRNEHRQNFFPNKNNNFNYKNILFPGARFGQLQARIGLSTILSKYRVSLNEKCEIPIRTRKHFVGSVISEVWLNVEQI